jgi:hypothetical protein
VPKVTTKFSRAANAPKIENRNVVTVATVAKPLAPASRLTKRALPPIGTMSPYPIVRNDTPA